MDIRVELTKTPKEKPADENKLGFGKIFTDHMFMMNYTEGQGWHDARIVPYGPLVLSPACSTLHYGQTVFEGMKAYRAADGRVLLFRPQENFKRMNRSCDRLAIPHIDEEFALKALCQLLELEKDWIPRSEGTSLYIRPTIIANDDYLGVKVASEYIFYIILSPSGRYYESGLDPVNLYIEEKWVRASKGGMGTAKTAGNYAASLLSQEEAHEQGYAQVLWLDGVERKYIEEVGSMNVFFVVGDEVVTPELDGSILPGITRMSCIELLKDWGVKVTERKFSVEELVSSVKNGTLKEAFGTGTAAVVSPIGEMRLGDETEQIGDHKIGKLTQKLYDTITGIQTGVLEDPKGWRYEVCKG
ncbi:MAG TPA: branched-chain amino acid aminotransferase [Firmicutes bacterium]|nr:branched-chain amino acid aminotransferase [Bacillota bacterium]